MASMFTPGYLQFTLVKPGARLSAHVDTPSYGDIILTLNIGDIKVTLTDEIQVKGGKKAEPLETRVPSFGLYGLAEESRSYAKHKIEEMAGEWRIGVTVRYFHVALVELLLLQDHAAEAAAAEGKDGGGDGEEDRAVAKGTLVYSQWPESPGKYPNIYPATIVSGPSSSTGLYSIQFTQSCHNIGDDFDGQGWVQSVARSQFVTRALVARRWSQDLTGSWTRTTDGAGGGGGDGGGGGGGGGGGAGGAQKGTEGCQCGCGRRGANSEGEVNVAYRGLEVCEMKGNTGEWRTELPAVVDYNGLISTARDYRPGKQPFPLMVDGKSGDNWIGNPGTQQQHIMAPSPKGVEDEQYRRVMDKHIKGTDTRVTLTDSKSCPPCPDYMVRQNEYGNYPHPPTHPPTVPRLDSCPCAHCSQIPRRPTHSVHDPSSRSPLSLRSPLHRFRRLPLCP